MRPGRRTLPPSYRCTHARADLGCYRDKFPDSEGDANGRRLEQFVMVVDNAQQCFNLARTLAARVFGLQFGGECWLGNSVERAMSLGPSDQCTMPCGGEPEMTCGGPLANDLYTVLGPALPPSPPREAW